MRIELILLPITNIDAAKAFYADQLGFHIDYDVTVRALFIRRGEDLYVIESSSIYDDHPQFTRLANGFTVL